MENEDTKLILFGFLATFGICTLIYIGNQIIPDAVKLNAQVWGTINDWIIYGVTVVTAVFFYKTLKSQMEVQKMQQKITSIEDFKFRRSIMPRFEVKGVPPTYQRDSILTRYHIVAKDNLAKNVNIRCESKSSTNSIYKHWIKKEVNKDQQINLHHAIPKDDVNHQSFEIRINITFEDVAKNKYLQYAEIIKPDPQTQSYGERTEPTPITDGPVAN